MITLNLFTNWQYFDMKVHFSQSEAALMNFLATASAGLHAREGEDFHALKCLLSTQPKCGQAQTTELSLLVKEISVCRGGKRI